MDTGNITLVLNSSDTLSTGPISPTNPTGKGLAGDYYTQLPRTILMPGDWECCMVSLSCLKPNSLPRSIFVTLDCLEYSQAASDEEQVLFISDLISAPVPTNNNPVYFQCDTGVVPWRRVTKDSLSAIRVRIFDSNGTTIPNTYPVPQPPPLPPKDVEFPSTLQIILRQISHVKL